MSDRSAPTGLAAALARRSSARARLFGTLEQVQTKLNPISLAQDAVEGVAANLVRDTVDTVRARPRAVIATATVALLFLARKPLGRLLKNGAGHATAVVPTSLKARRKMGRAPQKGSSK